MLWDDGTGGYSSGVLSLSGGTRTRSWSGTSGDAMRALNIAAHTHTVTGTVNVANASYTPLGSISGSSHIHTFTTGAAGTGAAIDMRPSYYKLAFIMKL
jgi:K+-transporting ATPase A subunit